MRASGVVVKLNEYKKCLYISKAFSLVSSIYHIGVMSLITTFVGVVCLHKSK